MRYFDEQLVSAHPRQHGAWWSELQANREQFHVVEENLARLTNQAAILPRDAWLDMDTATRAIMRGDEGSVWMNDLMPLAKPVNIGKMVHMNRVSSGAGNVTRSFSGQVAQGRDKTTYDYRGTPVPIFTSGYGREWREWNTLQSENFDALIDDQENVTRELRKDNALYVLDGDAELKFQGYSAYGIRTSPYSKSINLGDAVGGADIDLTSAATTSDDIISFINNTLGGMLDDNLVAAPVNLYISAAMGRNWDRDYSGAAGYKSGTLMQAILANRRIAKIEVSHELTGNEFFGFVPSAEYIRPLVGMATSTFAVPRLMPMANYDFMTWNAMAIEIRADYNGKSGVFYSVVVNA